MVIVITLKKWIKRTVDEITKIKTRDPKDRLSYIDSIIYCNNAVVASGMGWSEWLQNPSVMSEFTKEEIDDIHKHFKSIAIKFLIFDIKWTKIMSKKKLTFEENEEEDIVPTNEKDNKTDTSYIS